VQESNGCNTESQQGQQLNMASSQKGQSCMQEAGFRMSEYERSESQTKIFALYSSEQVMKEIDFPINGQCIVRGSPLIVIMVLSCRGRHIPCPDNYAILVMYLLAGVHQSREELNSRPVAGGARPVRDFFHSWILCGTCLCQARQLLVNASKRALHYLTVMAGHLAWHTSVL